MTTIDEPRLESDLGYRFEYLAGFMGFGPDDIAAIHGAAPALAPLVPGLVDAVYQKLYSYTATWRHFLPRQHGYTGDIAVEPFDYVPDGPGAAARAVGYLKGILEGLATR